MDTKSIDYKSISGEYYDYTKTLKPEQSYIHDYTKTMTMKLLLSIPTENGDTKVFCDFLKALEIIKKTDKLTRGIKKIIYLVGWQYNGHDDKYPSFSEVNKALKRPEDETATDSLIWLMNEAFKYNTTVSLHINMTDAYMDSPLWDTYVKNNLIAKNDAGKFLKIGTWGANKTAYQVWYKNEWESGYAVKRIDELLNMLPIKRAGTIHIDAYICREFANSSMNEERQYRRKVMRYFRANGIDVTSEFLYDCPGRDVGKLPNDIKESQRDDLVGLMPMAWWLNQKQEEYINRPRSLMCGGRYNKDLDEKHTDALGFLVGNGVHGEDVFKLYNEKDNTWEKQFLKTFCLDGIPWYYQNRYKLLKIDGKGKNRIAIYEDDLIVSLKDKTIIHKGVKLRNNSDLFMPILWKENEIIAYSENGCVDKKFLIPENYIKYKNADIYTITCEGLILQQSNVSIQDNYLTLSLKENQAICIILK